MTSLDVFWQGYVYSDSGKNLIKKKKQKQKKTKKTLALHFLMLTRVRTKDRPTEFITPPLNLSQALT